MTIDDEIYMQRAIELGEKGRVTAPLTPWVGYVLVNQEAIIGEGCFPVGQEGSEIDAVNAAGSMARGAILYVTLEVSHPHVKTLVEAGISKVVIALLNPDVHKTGKGVEELRNSGIAVSVGVAEKKAADALVSYLHYRRTGRPYCVMKAAMSLDGKIAAADYSSKWITGQEGRTDALRWRRESQGILVGKGTDRFDEAQEISQLRVVLDAKGALPPIGPLFDVTTSPTLIFTALDTDPSMIMRWQKAGVEVEKVHRGPNGEELNLREVLMILGRRGIVQLLLEGGAAMNSVFLKANLIDRLVLYIGGCVLGSEGMPLFSGDGLAALNKASRWKCCGMQSFGNDVRLEYEAQELESR